MVEQAEERRSVLTPARLVVGSLVAGAGLVLLGFFWSAGSASAAEPPQPGPLAQQMLGSAGSLATGVDATVSSTSGRSGGTVASAGAPVAAPVAAIMPEQAQHAVSAVPVTDAVQDVAASAPVEQAVAPAVTVADDLTGTILLAKSLLGADPVSTVVTPLAGTVDHLVGALAGLTSAAAGAISGRTAPGYGTAMEAGFAMGGLASALAGRSSPAASGASSSGGFGGSSAIAVAVSFASGPPLSPGGSTPLGQPAALGGGAASPGAGASGPATGVPADLFALSAAASGSQGHATDDRLPASPVAAHDTSPD